MAGSEQVRPRAFRTIALGSAMCISLVMVAPIRGQNTAPTDQGSASPSAPNKNDKKSETGMVKLKIEVLNPKGNPVPNASVYVRFDEKAGLLGHDKLAEMNFKTNQDGSVK